MGRVLIILLDNITFFFLVCLMMTFVLFLQAGGQGAATQQMWAVEGGDGGVGVTD